MTNEKRSRAALEETICYFGGTKQTAAMLGIARGSFTRLWRRGRVSGPQARRIHELTGGIIHRESLRPDLFPTKAERERNICKLIAALRKWAKR